MLIVVHEYGHYRVAVACGVKVLRFSVGFGRVLWRRQATPDATEFVLCALPLGGYVRMLDEREGDGAAGASGRGPSTASRCARRAAIVAAGPLANLGLAVLLYAAAHWIGIDEPKAVLGPPAARQPGRARRPARRRLGARAVARRRRTGRTCRSMTDLRWQVTQAALQREALQLQVSDARRPRLAHAAAGPGRRSSRARSMPA